MSGNFVFVDSPSEFCDDAALVVRLPRGLSSKQKLFAVLADKLKFPRYFGWNWDALDECLRDLSWLPSGRRVIVVHESLPFFDLGNQRQIYLDVLRSRVEETDINGHVFSAVFPSSLRDAVIQATTERRQST